MKVNVFAPVNVAELLLPCVAKSKLKRIIMMSSIMGSIAHVSDAKSPNAIAYSPPPPPPNPPLTSRRSYRSSKAALNMAMRAMALQLQVPRHTLAGNNNTATHTPPAAPGHHVREHPPR
jgi:NAD(P)-dependent dehydrogenase (short-subunit alcohol dehydrogenase family)